MKYESMWSKCQGSKGISQWPINCCTSPIIIHKITPYVHYNLVVKCFHTQPKEQTNENSKKVLKVVKQTNKKTLS